MYLDNISESYRDNSSSGNEILVGKYSNKIIT